jgi:alpha-mannosidase
VVGPVVSEFSVEHPFGALGRFGTTVRLAAGLGRIEVHTHLLNRDEFVRYRALFPTTIAEGRGVHEIPFGAIERPSGIEFPAQNWVDWSDGQHGLALLNRGLPGHAVHDGTLLLSLCRSTCIVAYGFGGGYEPGMSSDSGLELDRELAFDYALVPHAGDWRGAEAYRLGLEFNHPLLAVTAAPHTGALPGRWGYLEVSPGNVVVSALKPSRAGTAVLRVYEAAGRATPGTRVRLPAGTQRVEETNLMEDPVSELGVSESTVQFDLRPFEIKTLRLGFSGGYHAP